MNHVIIVAAGQGSRLQPLTQNKPKCMVTLKGKPLLHHQIASLRSAGIKKITVVTGYRSDRVEPLGASTLHNPDHATTNMIYSLTCARHLWGQGFILAYSDIVYEPRIIEHLLRPSTAPITVIVDHGWRSYWESRFDNPLDDAETLRLDASDRILEIGGKTDTIRDIMGQFIGLVRFDQTGVAHLENTLASIEDTTIKNMQTTHLMQIMIQNNIPIKALPISRGWMEIDNKHDLSLAEQWCEVVAHQIKVGK